MKKISTIIFIAILAATACTSGTGDSNQKAAAADTSKVLTTIQWLDSAKQIGKITEGEKVEITYRFVNTGNQPLVIQSVVPTCGCTVAEKPDQPIAPGKEGLIKAVFDSHGRAGSQHKTLTVYSNTETSFHPLTFDVEVLAK